MAKKAKKKDKKDKKAEGPSDKRLKADKRAKAGKDKGSKKSKKVSAVPKGLHTVTPNLIFKESVRAIEFYRAAFGAKELSRMMSPDGRSVWHAEIQIGDGVIYLNDESPMGHSVAASDTHRATCAIQLYVKDCDAWFARAVTAGAKVSMPVADMFWGDRMGGVIDPFGIYWVIATRTHDLSKKEMVRAGEEFARKMAETPASAVASAAPAPAQPSSPDANGSPESGSGHMG